MYKVFFYTVLVAVLDDSLKACGLALNLHQFSNVPHEVRVVDVKNQENILKILVPSKDVSSDGNKS